MNFFIGSVLIYKFKKVLCLYCTCGNNTFFNKFLLIILLAVCITLSWAVWDILLYENIILNWEIFILYLQIFMIIKLELLIKIQTHSDKVSQLVRLIKICILC